MPGALSSTQAAIIRTKINKENGDDMSESVNLPALGESVTEGTVTRWLKQVGDRVEVD